MVKRKKIGFNLAEDEKHQDEGMCVNIQAESAKTSDIALESNCPSQLPNIVRNRVHSTRTATKESQNIQESLVSENPIQDKIAKPLSNQRCSNRVPKRAKKDDVSASTSLKKAGSKPNVTPDGSKTRRPWELWSVEDKNSFFEALCEYGKDFENIQNYIAQRSKKKGISSNMIKNKDQVRHFYYRTWHKISKYLDIGQDVRKHAQELYGLINYAELRKKIGSCLNMKNSLKLNELVFNGVTTIKFKGKKMRIKTPVCRALKKLNNVAEPKVPVVEKLPKEIIVEFRPSTNEAWLQVQNLAQNPRVRTKLCLQRRLKSVIEYLENRWKPYRLKKKEQVLSSLPQATDLSPFGDQPPMLHIKPRKDSAISLLTISVMDNASSSDVCLEKYMKHFVQEISNNETVKVKKGKLKPKPVLGAVVSPPHCSGDKLQENPKRDESLSRLDNCLIQPEICPKSMLLPSDTLLEDSDAILPEDSFSGGILTPPKSVPEQDQTENPVNEAERSLSLLKSMLCPMKDNLLENERDQAATISEMGSGSANAPAPECRTIEEVYLNTQQVAENMTLGQLLGMGSEKHPQYSDNTAEKSDSLSTNSADNKCIDSKSSCYISDCDFSQKLKDVVEKGWNTKNAGLLTVGELYLMLGRPSKVILQYEWKHPVVHKDQNESLTPVFQQSCAEDYSLKHQACKLAEVLRKLMSVASTTFAEFKNKQQNPLSPPVRNISATRISSVPTSVTKPGSRGSSKNTNVKTNIKARSVSTNEKIVKDSSISQKKPADVTPATESTISNQEKSLTIAPTSANLTPPEKNFFVVPVGTAPRAVKHPTQESLREEIDKLLPGTRRGCRVRRKPLVVQRTLLPREGMNSISSQRPMAVVHLVPSVSQLSSLATVIPANCTPSESKIGLPANKNVVKILSAGSAIDVRPLQVPILNTVNSDTSRKVILQSSNLSTAHLMMTSTSSSTIHVLDSPEAPQSKQPNVNNSGTVSIAESISSHSVIIKQPVSSQKSLITTNSNVHVPPIVSVPLSSMVDESNIPPTSSDIVNKATSILPTISIPDPTMASTSAVSPTSVSSLMELPLPDSLPSESTAGLAGEQLLDFGDGSNLSVSFDLSPAKTSNEASHPISLPLGVDTADSSKSFNSAQKSPSRKFRISSPGPDAQWLNGESIEVSFNTLLNTLETPFKVLPSSTMSSSGDNSNLDPIVGFGPVVDSQVRCLLEECSIDFIAKFEDLADVINSSAPDNKST